MSSLNTIPNEIILHILDNFECTSDLKIARSVLCPKNPDFPICQRNEVSVWEDAFMTPEMALAFCTSLPNNDCDKDK